MNLEDRIKRLEALHPELKPEVEWVYMPAPEDLNIVIRISADGTIVEQMIQGAWTMYDVWWVKGPYRAGLAQGQKQALGLAEAVLHGSRWTDTSRLARAILEAAE